MSIIVLYIRKVKAKIAARPSQVPPVWIGLPVRPGGRKTIEIQLRGLTKPVTAIIIRNVHRTYGQKKGGRPCEARYHDVLHVHVPSVCLSWSDVCDRVNTHTAYRTGEPDRQTFVRLSFCIQRREGTQCLTDPEARRTDAAAGHLPSSCPVRTESVHHEEVLLSDCDPAEPLPNVPVLILRYILPDFNEIEI